MREGGADPSPPYAHRNAASKPPSHRSSCPHYGPRFTPTSTAPLARGRAFLVAEYVLPKIFRSGERRSCVAFSPVGLLPLSKYDNDTKRLTRPYAGVRVHLETVAIRGTARQVTLLPRALRKVRYCRQCAGVVWVQRAETMPAGGRGLMRIKRPWNALWKIYNIFILNKNARARAWFTLKNVLRLSFISFGKSRVWKKM